MGRVYTIEEIPNYASASIILQTEMVAKLLELQFCYLNVFIVFLLKNINWLKILI